MLISNRNHVENTIDAIFQMDGPPRPKAPSPRTPARRQSAPQEYLPSHQQTPPPQRHGSFQGAYPVPNGTARETYRGRRYNICYLLLVEQNISRCFLRPLIPFHTFSSSFLPFLQSTTSE